MKSLPKNYLLALIIFIGVLTWIASGFFKSETMDNSLEINSEIVEEKIAVRAKDIYGEDKTYFLTVRGRTEAEKRVLLRPKTSSTVIKTIDKGSFVKKGDIICSLDPENRSARLIEAEAGKNQAQLQYDGPVTQTGAQMRNTPQGSFLRGLMTNIISSGIDYIEKNRNKLGK
jgi:multidrug efflux system membrane fusion protein